MSTISTHVLDTALGKPAAGMRVILEQVDDVGSVVSLGVGETDSDGRLRDLLGRAVVENGIGLVETHHVATGDE